MNPSSLTSSLLLLALIFPTLSVLNSLLQLVRRSDARVGWFGALLALVSGVVALGVFVAHTFVNSLSPDPAITLIPLGLFELLFGLALVLIVERRRASFSSENSYGLLVAGAGMLTVVAAIFIPLLPGQFFPPAEAQHASAPAVTTLTAVPTLTRTPRLTVTPSLMPSPRASATATLPPTESPTRERYSTPTPSSTPTAAVYCGAMTLYNLNLRAGPSPDTEILLTIPYNTTIQVGGRNEEQTWWFVVYNSVWGWVDGGYLTLDSNCNRVPVRLDR